VWNQRLKPGKLTKRDNEAHGAQNNAENILNAESAAKFGVGGRCTHKNGADVGSQQKK